MRRNSDAMRGTVSNGQRTRLTGGVGATGAAFPVVVGAGFLRFIVPFVATKPPSIASIATA